MSNCFNCKLTECSAKRIPWLYRYRGNSFWTTIDFDLCYYCFHEVKDIVVIGRDKWEAADHLCSDGIKAEGYAPVWVINLADNHNRVFKFIIN